MHKRPLPPQIFLSLSLLLILLSCNRLPTPDFSYHPGEDLEAGDTISFVNNSRHADAYEWDFGDGSLSYESHPDYSYDSTGIFDVSLTALNAEGSDRVTQPITIREPTILGFLVYDSTGTLPLSQAEVRVYEEEEARDALSDPDYTGFTDADGRLEFRNLESIVYHIWVSGEAPGGTWTFRGYTEVLTRNLVNYYTVHCLWTEAQSERSW